MQPGIRPGGCSGFKAGRKVWITANNKAEGSAPLSLIRLAEETTNNLQSTVQTVQERPAGGWDWIPGFGHKTLMESASELSKTVLDSVQRLLFSVRPPR